MCSCGSRKGERAQLMWKKSQQLCPVATRTHTRAHTLTLTYTLVCMKIQIKRNAVNNIKASVSCTKKKRLLLLWPSRDAAGALLLHWPWLTKFRTWAFRNGLDYDDDVAMKFVKCELQILRSFSHDNELWIIMSGYDSKIKMKRNQKSARYLSERKKWNKIQNSIFLLIKII